MARFSMRGIARELECQPAVLYYYVRSKKHLLEAVANGVERRLTAAMFVVASGIADNRAHETVRQAVDAFLRFASEDPNSWELLFLHPAASSVGRRVRLALERRLASLVDSGERTDKIRANAAASAKLTMTVAMGEAAIRVCRPALIGPGLSARQIVDLFHQRTNEG